MKGILHHCANRIGKAFLPLPLMLLAIFSPLKVSAQGQMEALSAWRAGTVVSADSVRAFGMERCFKAEEISDVIFRRMLGRSFKEHTAVKRNMLRYLKVLHYDAEGRIRIGEMVCNRLIADDLVSIFRQLFDARYPIERMTLIDDYDADDELSMSANNTSCFCYRVVKGSKRLSAHSLGMAVDINPRYNPYVRRLSGGKLRVRPANGRGYSDRSKRHAYTLLKGDLCHRLFTSRGFIWGGSWRSVKDYQHFEKH